MKYKTLILGVLAVMLALVGMASAQQEIVFQGDITPSFSCSIASGNPAPYTFVIGTNNFDANSITVASNTGYVIKAKDEMIHTKPVGTEGHMVIIDTTNGGWSTKMTNPFKMKYNGGSYVALTGADQTIYSASAGELTAPLGIQQVVAAADPVPGANHKYQIETLVTCSAS